MQLLKKYKNILIVVALIVVAFAGYSFFIAGETEPLLTAETGRTAIESEVLALLLELRSLKLDESIFDDEVFNTLRDFSQALVPEPVGRRNPFAPLGVGDEGLPTTVPSGTGSSGDSQSGGSEEDEKLDILESL